MGRRIFFVLVVLWIVVAYVLFQSAPHESSPEQHNAVAEQHIELEQLWNDRLVGSWNLLDYLDRKVEFDFRVDHSASIRLEQNSEPLVQDLPGTWNVTPLDQEYAILEILDLSDDGTLSQELTLRYQNSRLIEAPMFLPLDGWLGDPENEPRGIAGWVRVDDSLSKPGSDWHARMVGHWTADAQFTSELHDDGRMILNIDESDRKEVHEGRWEVLRSWDDRAIVLFSAPEVEDFLLFDRFEVLSLIEPYIYKGEEILISRNFSSNHDWDLKLTR